MTHWKPECVVIAKTQQRGNLTGLYYEQRRLRVMAEAPTLDSNRLVLRNFTQDMISTEYISWLSNSQAIKYSEQSKKKHTRDSCENYLRGFASTDNYFFSIWKKSTAGEEMIGTATVYIDSSNLVGDLGLLIGRTDLRGNGYGYEAWITILDWVKTLSQVEKVTAGTISSNKAMRTIIEKSGMSIEATRKKHVLLNGQRHDVALYYLLKTPQ